MEPTFEIQYDTAISAFTKQWIDVVRGHCPEAPKFDIVVQHTNAKIRRMSPRRQKLTLSRKPSTVFKDCTLVSVGEVGTCVDGLATVDVTFEYQP